MHPIRFKPHRRAELGQLGIVDGAIELIEAEALPEVRRMLKHAAPKVDVRGELDNVARAIERASVAIEALLDAPDSAPHRVEARWLISGGGRRSTLGGLVLHKTAQALGGASQVIAEAKGRLPQGPRRHQTANLRPIELIHVTLQRGLMFAGLESLPTSLKPSSSPGSPFRQVMGICYEAVDAPSDDPERALKAYVKKWREESKHFDSIGLGQNVP